MTDGSTRSATESTLLVNGQVNDEQPMSTFQLLIYLFLIYLTCVAISYAVILYLNIQIDSKKRQINAYKQYYFTELSTFQLKNDITKKAKTPKTSKLFNMTKIDNQSNNNKAKTSTERTKKSPKNN